MDPNLYNEDYLSRSASDSDSEGYCCGQAEEMERNYRRRQRKMESHPYNSPRATAARTRKNIADLYDGGALDSQISSQEYIDNLQGGHSPMHSCVKAEQLHVSAPEMREPASDPDDDGLLTTVPPRTPVLPIDRVPDPFAPINASGEIEALRIENARLRLEMEKRAGDYYTKLEELSAELAGCRAKLGKWSELGDAARVVFGDTRASLDRFLGNLDDTEANV